MLVLAGILFGSVFGMKWFGNRMMNQYLDAMPVPPATISSVRAETMLWDNRLAAVGSLVAVNGADITTEVDGVVTEIHFESGDQVEAGAPLISLDAAIERGELQRLQAQADLAELDRKRLEALYQRKTISKSEYDTAVAHTAAAEAAVDAQRGRVAQKELRAPFAGRLGIRRVNVGEYLSAGSAVVTLQSLDPIDLDFSLPERYLGAVQPGLAVDIQVAAWPGQTFRGQVTAIEPKVESATRNFNLRARLANPEQRLQPGQFANVRLNLAGERSVIVVPRTAISYNSYGASVFVIRENPDAAPPPKEPIPGAPPYTRLEVVQRFVETGEARGDFVAIHKGLEEGEEIASAGLLKLRNGQPVIIDNQLRPQAELDPTPAEG